MSKVVGPRPSVAWATARSARRAIQAPAPSSPAIGPQPPAQIVLPRAFMPQQIEPVPAMTINPGSPSVAPYKAMSASPTTTISPMPRPSSASRIRAFNSRRRAPASPISAAIRSVRRSSAFSQARSIASRIAVAALAMPTRSGFDAPARPSPSTRKSAARITARVFVPPPSTPTTARLVDGRRVLANPACLLSVVTIVGGRRLSLIMGHLDSILGKRNL